MATANPSPSPNPNALRFGLDVTLPDTLNFGSAEEAAGNPFAPINLIKELVPATGADVTGQHESVDGSACLECHTSFRAISGGTRSARARVG